MRLRRCLKHIGNIGSAVAACYVLYVPMCFQKSTLCVPTYYAPKAEKKALLVQANIQLEIIRHYFRLGYDLGLYASTKYQYFAETLHEIGSMTGGWIKSLESKS